MYYNHFGLSQPPFRITPNTEFFYSGGNRGPILEALIYAIGQGEGIIKVTGEVGSGKTMLCTMLQARLPPNVETIYIANPSVSPEEIVHAVALELQLKPPREAGHLEVMQALHHHLLERHAQGKQVVMFVEESQSMPIATLEEIRLLSNLETAQSKLLQIVLFGQPELDDNLSEPRIRQLRERITHSFRLSPLKHDEIRDYLNFRLRAAGYRGPDLFSPAVVRAIAKASAGLTRRINLIADKALLAAFSENTHTVKLKHVEAAVRDSAFSNYEPRKPRLKLALALSLLAVGGGLGLVLSAIFLPYHRDTQPARQGEVSTNSGQPALTEQAAPALSAPPATAGSAREASSVAVPGGTPEASTAPPIPLAAAPVGTSNTTPAELAAGSVQPTTLGSNEEVSADSRALAPALDALDERLSTTRKWLAEQDKSAYTIQLLGAEDARQLKHHLKAISKYVEINDIFVYRTIAKEKPSLTVLYGSFDDRGAARDALAKLPASLKAFKPILRTVQGVRDEIAQHPSA